MVGIVKKGPGGQNFSKIVYFIMNFSGFNYDNRENVDMFVELGAFMINVSRIVKNGILVVFSSYPVLEK